MVADPMPDMDGDPKFKRAKSTLSRFSPSGQKKRVKAMKGRALWTILLGAVMLVLGVLLVMFFKDMVPVELSGPLAFLGVVIIGFGLVVFLTAR